MSWPPVYVKPKNSRLSFLSLLLREQKAHKIIMIDKVLAFEVVRGRLPYLVKACANNAKISVAKPARNPETNQMKANSKFL